VSTLTKKRITTKKPARGRGVTLVGSTKQVRYVPSNAEISERAYEIYLDRGGEDGHDIEDWLQAESELSQELTVTH